MPLRTPLVAALAAAALSLLPGAHAHAYFAECGSRGAGYSLEPGDPLPRGMGRGTIDESTRPLTVRNLATELRLETGAAVAPGATLSIEVPLLPGEQVVCEATGGALFPNNCHRQANELIFAARAPASGSFSVWCVHSSGPGQGMYATEPMTFVVNPGQAMTVSTVAADLILPPAGSGTATGAADGDADWAESGAPRPPATPAGRHGGTRAARRRGQSGSGAASAAAGRGGAGTGAAAVAAAAVVALAAVVV